MRPSLSLPTPAQSLPTDFRLQSLRVHCTPPLSPDPRHPIPVLFSPSPHTDIEAAPGWRPRPAPSALRLLLDEERLRLGFARELLGGIGLLLREPRDALSAAARAGADVWEALREGVRLPASTPLNLPIGPHRQMEWRTMDLEKVKQLRRRLGGTVNDVVLAVVAGGLRTFLGQRGVELTGLDYRIVVPVNMRSGQADLASSNRVAGQFLSLPLDEPDPRRRFSRIAEVTRELKAKGAARGIELFTRLADLTGSTLLTQLGVRMASLIQPYNLIVTNVPGPQFPLYLLGARMLEVYPQLPLFENQGLGVAVMSYDGSLGWGLTGDSELVPDLVPLGDALMSSLDELDEATGTEENNSPRR